ncbi:MAG: hypothetical protein PHI19_05675 [Clostridia bacterium]|nr:hypothetical protein [Clostridia bacterium]
MEIGLQTYTIKKTISTPEGFEKAMEAVSAAGIKYLEIAVDYLKFPFDGVRAQMMKSVLDCYGIKAISCQIRQGRMERDFDCCLKAMKTLGVSNITNSVIDVRCLKDGERGVAEYAERLEKYRLKMETNGLFVAHHNHHFECLRYGGKTVFDIMAANFHGNFVLDTYWLTRGGIDPIGLIMKLNDRVRIMHIRDYKLQLSLLGLRPKDTELGRGNLDFTYLLFKADKYGVEYGMIEQSTKNELESVKISAANAMSAIGRI